MHRWVAVILDATHPVDRGGEIVDHIHHSMSNPVHLNIRSVGDQVGKAQLAYSKSVAVSMSTFPVALSSPAPPLRNSSASVSTSTSSTEPAPSTSTPRSLGTTIVIFNDLLAFPSRSIDNVPLVTLVVVLSNVFSPPRSVSSRCGPSLMVTSARPTLILMRSNLTVLRGVFSAVVAPIAT